VKVGHRLLRENLLRGRAAYGKQILATVSQELTAGYGRGFRCAEIVRIIQFAQLFPDKEIVVTLSRQFSRLSNALERSLPEAYRMLGINHE
jgi:hypothetical protein